MQERTSKREEMTNLHLLQTRQRRSALLRLLLYLHAPQKSKLQTSHRTFQKDAWYACRIASITLCSLTLKSQAGMQATAKQL